MIIDAHQHIWDPALGCYPWLEGVPELDRAVTTADVASELERHDVDGVVLVQAADDPRDTELMLRAARADPVVAGVVAWAPLDRPGELPELLAGLVAEPAVVGVRALVHERPPGWIARAEVVRGLGVVESAGLPFDLVTADVAGLAELEGVRARHPDLVVVVDHLGRAPLGAGARDTRERWLASMTAAARHPATFLKISGLTGPPSSPAGWSFEDAVPFFEQALELFGADRLMWGSDWPLCTRAGGFERIVAVVERFVGSLSPTERAAILAGTALRVYGLEGWRR